MNESHGACVRVSRRLVDVSRSATSLVRCVDGFVDDCRWSKRHGFTVRDALPSVRRALRVICSSVIRSPALQVWGVSAARDESETS
jgi:hypothetical protein